jgi:hypothetical protein
MFGVDYSWGRPDVTAMKNAGVYFCCRYIALPQAKMLTLAEAQMLSDNALDVVSNYEWTKMRTRDGYDAGASDANTAVYNHQACGGPDNAPIYFSVDYDSDGTADEAYFRGAISVLGLPRVGGYGGYKCIKHLLDVGLISWAWQTYAWSAGQWDARANIHQYLNNQMLGGAQVDYDESMTARFGQWRIWAKSYCFDGA